MLYTVKQVSELTNVTIKTLYYYHKIGLLLPYKTSEAGYRFYGVKELERLQQILFYRELDFPIKKIHELLDGERERLSILSDQRKLLLARMRRIKRLVQTIDESIHFTMKGDTMDKSEMFKGFESEKEWVEAMTDQNQYLKEKYDYDLLKENSIEVQSMNEQALEAKHFMDNIANALKEGVKFNDEKVQVLIKQHIDFLNSHGHNTRAEDFAIQARFFLNDDFHRNMLEAQQTGFSYYLCMAAETFALK